MSTAKGSRRKQTNALIELARAKGDAKAEEAALLKALADELTYYRDVIDRAAAKTGVRQRVPVPRAPSRYPSIAEDSSPLHREDLERIRAELDRGSRVISQVLEQVDVGTWDPDASSPTSLARYEPDDERDT